MRWILGLGILAFATGSGAASFEPLANSSAGDTATLATQVSGDGSTMLGFALEFVPGARSPRQLAFRWEDGGAPERLPDDLELSSSDSLVVSDDGSTVAATGTTDTLTRQHLVLRNGTYTALPGTPATSSVVEGISDDGRVIVTRDQRFVDGVGSDLDFEARGVSGDGRTVFGILQNSNPGFSLDGAAAQEIVLPDDAIVNDVPFVDIPAPTLAASFDGSILIGSYAPKQGLERKLFRWENGETGVLGPVGSMGSNAVVSGDGSIVLNGDVLFVGLERHLLADFLAELGLDVLDWTSLGANDISTDGRTIVGTGIDPQGVQRSWIAVIPEPGTGTLVGVGIATLAARRRPRTRRLRGHPGPLARGGETD